jgi:HEAT repeat protein
VARFLSPNERKSAGATALNWIKGRSGIIADRAVKRGTPINDMIEAGILSRHVANRLTFSNPSVGAYLAALEMVDSGISFEAAQLGWSPAENAMCYFSAMGDISAVADRYLEVRDDPLEEHLLVMSDWIREADGRAEWRARVLRELATIANAHSKPYGLRLRTIHALAYSNEMSVAVLFRRLLQSKYPSSRVLGALGLGGLRDEDSIDALIQTINERQNLHTRQAACLGLAGIGTESSLEGLGRLLLEGDETIRLSAGEALACDPNEGYSMLREAVEIENLLTRRAAVFGLSRVSEDWAFEILETIQVEDDQWVVRGAAAEALERRQNPPWHIQPPSDDIAELTWLSDFAAREGLGVAPGKAALEMIRRALNKGTPEEQIAAMEAIAWNGGDEFSIELTQALHSDESYLRDAAFEALWQLRAQGQEMPKVAA